MSNEAQEPVIVPVAVISPVRDESKYLRLTLDSMVAQTRRPREWLLVDDGSTDDTPDIINEYAEKYDFIRMVRKPDRGKRVLGGGVIEAFKFGRENLEHKDYEYIAKLDGDMSFDPKYLEIMLDKLESEPKLAAASGKVFRPEGDDLILEYQIDEQVAGQFKLYKREPFDQIGGFEQTILWDGIDIHRCRMTGWNTLSFFHEDARLYHHRLMGSSDKNVYRGRVRLGRGIWFMGYDPLYATASGVFRMHEKPYVIGGLIIIAAYFYALVRRDPQYPDKAFRQHLRKWQRRRLWQVISAPFRRLFPSAS